MCGSAARVCDTTCPASNASGMAAYGRRAAGESAGASAAGPTALPDAEMRATETGSLRETCSPTPNISGTTISGTTPISADSAASFRPATKPGVKGPTGTPAGRYSTSGWTRGRWAGRTWA